MARASPRMAVTPRAGWSMASRTSFPSRVSRRGRFRRRASFSIQRGRSTRTSVISAKAPRGSTASGAKGRSETGGAAAMDGVTLRPAGPRVNWLQPLDGLVVDRPLLDRVELHDAEVGGQVEVA